MKEESKHLKNPLHADSCEPVKEAIQAGEMELFGIARNNYPGVPFRTHEVPGVSCFGSWKTTGKQSYGLPTHQNEGIELTVSLQGESPVTVDGVNHTLRQGQIMITRPWQKHSIGDPCFPKGRIGWLILDVGVRHPHQEWTWPDWVLLSPTELKKLTRALRQNEDAIRPISPAYLELFNRLLLIAKTPEQPHRATRIALLVNSMLLELLVALDSTPATYQVSLTDSLRSIRLFLDQLPKRLHKPWTLQSMAEACGIGLTRFSTQFSTLTGETPAKHLLLLRLESAAQLLQNRELTLQEITQRVGFTTTSYFIHVFANHYGQTPAVFRKTHSR